MRFPKDFTNYGSGNRYSLIGSDVMVYQWNTGKNKNFMIDSCKKHPSPITVPGKGDEAMQRAIDMARSLA